MKTCKQGYYYCYTDKKCKKVPLGYHIGARGYLAKDDESEGEEDKNGNGSNGNGGNGNGTSNGNGGNGNGGGVSESKSGDSSLRDWFGKSRSSDGTPGWVQLGGKYAGKPCARQPGQTTKPKCGSSKMAASMSDKEEEKAFRRKNRQDSNPDRKGKAINVKTEEVVSEKKGEKDACYRKVKSRYSVWPSAYASGALVKCRKVGAANWGNKTNKEGFEYSNWRDDFKAIEYEFTDLIKPESISGGVLEEGQKCWKGYEKKGTKKMFGKTYNNCVKKEENEIDEMIGTTGIRKADPDAPDTYKKRKVEKKKLPKGYVKFYDKHGKGRIIDGKKVYEKFDLEVPSGNIKKLVKKAVKRIDTDADGDVDSGDKGGGKYGEYVPSSDGKKKIKTKVEHSDWRLELDEKLNLKKADMGDVVKDFYKSDAPQFKGKSKEKRREMAIAAKLSADESFEIDPKAHRQQQRAAKIRTLAQKGSTKGEKEAAERKTKGPKMFGEDWQKVNKSDKTDGMSAAAVKAYRRENPGSKLKTAVTGDPKPGSKDAKRRKSFCARSKGQQDMHNIDCSKTPDKPVCKARRRWKC
jgi:hypothetical protein